MWEWCVDSPGCVYFMSDCKVNVGGGGLVARVANTRFSSQCKERLKRALHTGRRCVPQ